MAQKRRNRAAAARSIFPINRLPREILAEVFWNCVPETIPEIIVQTRSSDAPLLLCCVCSSWRELALATPRMWTTVGILIHNKPDMDPSAAGVINAWLERSGSLPLTLHLWQFPSSYDVPWSNADPALVQSILSVFYSHSSRWQDVTLALLDTLSLSFPPLDAPLLQSFRLKAPYDMLTNFPFRQSPRLTELSWPHSFDVSQNPNVPWSQILYLDISSGSTLFAASEMIRLCTRLEEIYVDCSADDDELVPPHGYRAENSCLRILQIDCNKDISPLFNSLTLPALEELAYSYQDEDGDEVPSMHWAFLDFLTRSDCNLTTLKLTDCELYPHEFLECLEHKAFDTIRGLSIMSCPTLTDEVLIRLTHDLSPTAPRTLLPKLDRLRLEMCVEASPGVVGAMVCSRYYTPRPGVQQLGDLYLVAKELDEQDKSLLREVAANGLHAKFRARDDIIEVVVPPGF